MTLIRIMGADYRHYPSWKRDGLLLLRLEGFNLVPRMRGGEVGVEPIYRIRMGVRRQSGFLDVFLWSWMLMVSRTFWKVERTD